MMDLCAWYLVIGFVLVTAFLVGDWVRGGFYWPDIAAVALLVIVWPLLIAQWLGE